MKNSFFLFVAALLCFFASCKKSDSPLPDGPDTEIVAAVCPQGVSSGAAASAGIGANGGTLSSTDGRLHLRIPSGALSTETVISIEPITNTNPGGIGSAYRITPHGQQFAKPVKITFDYSKLSDQHLTPELLGIAYQDAAGIWQMMSGCEVDLGSKTVTYQSTHLSDWGMMQWLSLDPYQATKSEGERLTIKAMHYIRFAEDPDDILLPPLPGSYPVGMPKPLDTKYIKSWNVAGGGTLDVVKLNEAVYTAPDAIPSNMVTAVSVELVSDKHQLALVCNITLLSNDLFEMKIGSGSWVKYDAKAVQLDPERMSVAYVGDHASISMFWPTGKGTFPWGMQDADGGAALGFNYFVNDHSNVYTPQFEEDNVTKDSGGSVVVTSYGKVGEYVTGTFTILPSGYIQVSNGKQQSAVGIEGRFKLKRFF